MTFYFSPAKEEGGYASVSTSKWNEANSKVIFEEVEIKETDDAFFLAGHAIAFTDIKNFKDQNWQFQPGLIALKINKKDYSRTFNGEVKKYPQSALEKVLCEELPKWDVSKVYTGAIGLMYMGTYEPDSWQKCDDAMKAVLLGEILRIKPVTGEVKYLGSKKFEAPTVGTSERRGSGRVASVSEYEKLKSKEKYLVEKYQEYYPDEKIEKLSDLVGIVEKPGFYDVMTMYSYLLHGAKAGL